MLAIGSACSERKQPHDTSAPASSSSADRLEVVPPASAAAQLPKPSVGGRIYVDVSVGMKGFVHADARALGEVLRLVGNAAGEGAAKPVTCSLGANSHQCRKEEEVEQVDGTKKRRCVYWAEADVTSCSRPATYFTNEQAYTADISRLDAIVARQPKPERVDPDRPGAPDRIDEAELTVLVASQLDPGPLTTSSASACRDGPSPACVGAALSDRAKQGYGVWLLSLSLRFNGDFVAHVAKDKRFVAATEAHLKDLKLIASGETPRFVGIDFKVGPVQRDTSPPDPNRSVFHYEGVRPLMLFVIAREPATGRRFVASLQNMIKGSPVLRPGTMTPDEIVQSVELAPLSLPTYRLSAVDKPAAAGQGGIEPAAVAEFQFGKSAADGAGVTASATCGAKGKAWTVARFDELPGGGQLPPFVLATPLLRGPIGHGGEALPANVSLCERSGGNPECTVVGEARGLRIAANCAPLSVRAKPWLVDYGLRRRVDLDLAAMEKSFLGQLSAADTYTMPERVYGLKEVAVAVFKNATSGDDAMGRVQYAITRVE